MLVGACIGHRCSAPAGRWRTATNIRTREPGPDLAAAGVPIGSRADMGPPTWAQVMARAHHHPAGFSALDRAERHFTTSIDVGDHLARMLLRRCRAAADRHGMAEPWIVDVGAGSGRLLRQLLHLGFPGQRLLGIDVRSAPGDLPVNWIQGVAPQCVPRLRGLLVAHEFLDDVPADLVEAGRVLTVDGAPGPPASAADLQWLAEWKGGDSGLVGRHRDAAWAALVGRVEVGEAVAVDFWDGAGPVGHRTGRRLPASPDPHSDISAGVELRSCRAVTGGRLIPQRRLLADLAPRTVQERSELAVLRDPDGLGGFGWLITDGGSVGSPA